MEAMPNCQVAKVRHMHSLWMFGFKFHGFSSVTTGANVEMRKSMSANSRNPADLTSSNSLLSLEQMPGLQSVTKVDGLI